MSNTEWMSYLGAITGVIGAVTGIAGAIMGYVSYRRSGQMKTLDLRLEFRKAENDLDAEMKYIFQLMERAKQSHAAVASATGGRGSGRYQLWLSEYEVDLASAKLLEDQVPKPNDNYEKMPHSELETKLVLVHAIHSKAIRLREKYRASLDADDKEREQIRADVRVRTQAKL